MGPPRVVAMLPATLQRESCCPVLRRHEHFFCPRNPRNRELLEAELPGADTVRRTRSIFEAANIWSDWGSVSSGVSSGDLSSPAGRDSCSDEDEDSDWEESSFEDQPEPPRLVPALVMERIRARGSSITYFGGRVVSSPSQPASPTRVVLSEIQRSTEYQAWLNPGSGLPRSASTKSKGRLVKSNSCDSRLEVRADERDEVVRSERPATCWPSNSSVVFDFSGSRPRHQRAAAAPSLAQHPLFLAHAHDNTM